jgi:capsular exopolysaccharide synthesis family protein
VVESNNLAYNPEFVPQVPGVEQNKAALASRLEGMVTVNIRKGTLLIDVSAVDTNPKITALVANAVVEQYINFQAESRANTSKDAYTFLSEESNRLKAKMQQSERALQAIQEQSGSGNYQQGSTADGLFPELRDLSLRTVQARLDSLKQRIIFDQVARCGTDMHLLTLQPTISGNAWVNEIQGAILKAEIELENVKQRYKAKHPKCIYALGHLQVLKEMLTNTVVRAVDILRVNYEATRSLESEFVNNLRQMQTNTQKMGQQSVEYNLLVREVAADRALFDSILNRLKETSITSELQQERIRLVQVAAVPSSPFSPNVTKTMRVYIFGGLALGLLLAFGLNALDSSFKSIDEAEHYLNLPVLAAIPQLRDLKKTKKPLIVGESSKSMGAEAFRTLRTSLSMLGKEENRRTFLMTSALPQEGKSFCSLNFAASMAQSGLKTVLIDGDLRRPNVENLLFGKKSNHPGVTDFLVGKAKLDDIVRNHEIANFHFITAGATVPNPAELITQGGFDKLVEEALKKFDRVIVDSAPIHAVSDTLIMLNLMQTVAVVVRAGKTQRRAVMRCVQLLQGAGAKLSGVVFNMLPQGRGRVGYYYYDSYYHYGTYSKHGYYGDADKSKKK